MADAVTIPENLRAKAQEKGWDDDLVQQALATGASPEQLIGYLEQGITAEQARGFLAGQTRGGAEPSEEIKAAAAVANWPLELIQRALSMGAAESDLINYMNMG